MTIDENLVQHPNFLGSPGKTSSSRNSQDNKYEEDDYGYEDDQFIDEAEYYYGINRREKESDKKTSNQMEDVKLEELEEQIIREESNDFYPQEDNAEDNYDNQLVKEQNYMEKNIKEAEEELDTFDEFKNDSKEEEIDLKMNRNRFTIRWKNISFEAKSDLYFSKEKMRFTRDTKKILSNHYGWAKSGQFTAIMGPSGSGKSTLLECITCLNNEINGMSGKVTIEGISEGENAVIGYVPQHDHLLPNLTVSETMIFSTKLRYGLYEVDHESIVARIMEKFQLVICKDTMVQRCSGGQQKRLSIALEIMAKPNILILDEPTTGLDSSSCAHIIQVLNELTKEDKSGHAMTILATIHQPSTTTFSTFSQVYVLSKNGKCAYHGTPFNIVPTLNKIDLHMPSFNSPADYILEVVSGDYGENNVGKLEEYKSGLDGRSDSGLDGKVSPRNEQNLRDILTEKSHPFFEHLKILLHRSILSTYRDPLMTVLRFLMVISCGLSMSILFGDEVGKASGCLPSRAEVYTENLMVISRRFETEMVKLMENLSMIFNGLFIGLCISLVPVLLSFPKEMQCVLKEYRNNWYSAGPYYVAKAITDLPSQLILPVIFELIVFNMTGQPMHEPWRFYSITSLAILMAFIGQGMGETFGAYLCKSPEAAVYIGFISLLPMILVGGFLVRISRMPWYIQPSSYASFLRFGNEATMIMLYGFGRCAMEDKMFLLNHPSINITTLPTPKWAKYLPILLTGLQKKKTETNIDVDDYIQKSEEDFDDSTKAQKEDIYVQLMSMFGGNQLIDADGVMHTDLSIVLRYYDVTDKDIYRACAIILFYILFFRIGAFTIMKWKLRSNY